MRNNLTKFQANWKCYAFQTFMVVISILLLLLAVEKKVHDVVIVSVAASVYTVFVSPNQASARAFRIVGASVIALFIGLAFSYLSQWWLLKPDIYLSYYATPICGALAVGVNVLLTSIFDFVHPPSCAFTLGVVVIDWNMNMLILCMLIIFFAAAYQQYLRSSLIDL